MNNTVSNISLGGSAHLTAGNRDKEGEGWLRLTNATNNDVGYALVNESFSPGQGLVFDFEFAIWGGTGADGFSIFLFDANYSLDYPENDPLRFHIGNRGGSLGYANGNNENGLSGGYIGVGLDVFGNYGSTSESKNGGMFDGGLIPNVIGIRGSEHSNMGAPYRWLGGSQPLNLVFGNNFTLDYKGSSGSRPTKEQHYRRVQVRIIPVELNGVTTYEMSIHLKVNENDAFYPIVPAFTIADPPPPRLKIGFAGVTGGFNNIHEVRNLVVTTLGGIRVHKTVDKEIAYVGDELVYDIRLINESNFRARNLRFRDVIPAELNVSNIVFDNSGDSTNQVISGWQLGQLSLNDVLLNLNAAPYGEVKFRIRGTVEDYPPNNVLINTANFDLTSTSNISDDDLTNNISTVNTKIQPNILLANRDVFNFDQFESGNVLINDLFNAAPVKKERILLRVISAADPINNSNLTPYLDTNTGDIIVPPGTPRGNYRITYRLIDAKSVSNFSESEIELIVPPDIFNTQPEQYSINWVAGGKTGSVIENDRVNQLPVSLVWSKFEWIDQAKSGITLHTDGTIIVEAMSPKAQYTFRYRLTDRVSPDNFQENVVTLIIVPNKLIAVNDYEVVRYNRKKIIATNVLNNDLFNGEPISEHQINISYSSKDLTDFTINAEGDLILGANVEYGVYDLTYTICDLLDGSDCSIANIRLKILPHLDVIPNVITPNGDGLNDTFFISWGVEAYKMELKIYDRRGAIIYQNDNYKNNWSPTAGEVNEGTCFYNITVYFTETRKQTYKGSLLILRNQIQ